MSKKIHLIGYASGLAGADPRHSSGEGPLVMKRSPYLANLEKKNIQFQWHKMISPSKEVADDARLPTIVDLCQQLADEVYQRAEKKDFFTVLGGDHSSAIGTWSGAYHAYKKAGPIGLIWIDAHMDSHTPETSLSGNIHGMPLAALLGYGNSDLTQILDAEPKLKPEHVCLIGVRSFEKGEADLLQKLNVKIFFIEEVKQRGLAAVMKDALEIVTKGTIGFGVTIDIDSMDPADAPGTGVRAPNGLSAVDLCQAVQWIAEDSRLIGAEIVEFDPSRDINDKTEKQVVDFIGSFALGSQYHDITKDCNQASPKS